MDFDEKMRNPLLLEHTTRRLTLAAVDGAMELEQMRRTKHEEREREMAVRLYSPINRELVRLIAFNVDEEKKEKRAYHVLVETEKESVLQQLLHGTHQKSVDELMEEERERRVQLLEDLTDADKCTNDMDLQAVLKGLSKTHKVMQAFQFELMGAITDLEEVSHEESHAVDDLYLELKDDFVSSFRRATLLMKFHMAEENEKRRRMADARAIYTGRKGVDSYFKKSLNEKAEMQEELTRMFAGVIQEVTQKEYVMENDTQEHKTDAQEQLLHRLAIMQADQAAARERVDRVHEMEEELCGKSDPFKEHVKDIILNVQEQMLMNRFHGKRIMFRQPSRREYDQEYYEAESPQDRKLREARMKSRRHINVIVTEY
ncbi:uncharacterized protein [Amphiura filiformis]|uniref:uncharacterized protein n=1 Tax=Amphiura filiformis TaxID=82378 RepID=UPI003B224BB1